MSSILEDFELVQENGHSDDSSLVELENVVFCDIPTYYSTDGLDGSVTINGTEYSYEEVYEQSEEIIDAIINAPHLDFNAVIEKASAWAESGSISGIVTQLSEPEDPKEYTFKDYNPADRTQRTLSQERDLGEESDVTEQFSGCKSAIIEFAAETPKYPALEYKLFVKPGDQIDSDTIIGECMQEGKMKPIVSIFSKGVVREDEEDVEDEYAKLYKKVCKRHIIIDCYELAQNKSTDGVGMSWICDNPSAFNEWQNNMTSSEEAMYLITEVFPYLMYLRLVLTYKQELDKIRNGIYSETVTSAIGVRYEYSYEDEHGNKTEEMYFIDTEENEDKFINLCGEHCYTNAINSEDRRIFIDDGRERLSLEDEFSRYIKDKIEKRKEEYIEELKGLYGSEDDPYKSLKSTRGNFKKMKEVANSVLEARYTYFKDMIDLIMNPEFRFPKYEEYEDENGFTTNMNRKFKFKIPNVILPEPIDDIREVMNTPPTDGENEYAPSDLGDTLAQTAREEVNPIGKDKDMREYFLRLSHSMRSGGISVLEGELQSILYKFSQTHPKDGDATETIIEELKEIDEFFDKCLESAKSGVIKSVDEDDPVLQDILSKFPEEAKWPDYTDYDYKGSTYQKWTFPNIDAMEGYKEFDEDEDLVDEDDVDISDLEVPDADSLEINVSGAEEDYHDRSTKVPEELDTSEVPIDDIRYWVRYFGIATIVCLPFLATGIYIPPAEYIQLPCIFIPIKVFGISKCGLVIVLGLAIRGVSVNLIVLAINMNSQANSLIFPATMLLVDIRELVFSQIKAITDMVVPITKALLGSLKSNNVALLKENKKYDAEMAGLKGLKIPGKNTIISNIKKELKEDTRMIVNRLESDTLGGVKSAASNVASAYTDFSAGFNDLVGNKKSSQEENS